MNTRTEAIRRLNDRLRLHHVGGKIVVTSGLAAKGASFIAALDTALTNYACQLDPRDEHDYGTAVVEGETVVFKIDCFDLSGRHASPDPADERITLRVLTLMLGEEY